MSESTTRGILLQPGEGRTIQAGPSRITYKTTGEETGGALAVVEYTAGPGFPGPALHLHEHFDEAFYVLEGELAFRMGGETVRAPAGAFVLAPRGVPHTFANPGAVPARFLTLISPAGFERFYSDMVAVLPPGGGPPDPAAVQGVFARHDLVTVAEG